MPMQGAGLFPGTHTRVAAKYCLLACLSVAGCAIGQPAPQPVRGELVIPIERLGDVPAGQLVMKPISGGLLGRAADVELFRSEVNPARITLSVAALSRELERVVATARDDALNPGELADPRDLGMVRVATFFQPMVTAHGNGCRNFRTGLRQAWPQHAMLVYVDRPGSVRGARYSAPFIMEYDLQFPEAGLYSITTRSRGMRAWQQVAAPGSLVAVVARAPCGSRQNARQAGLSE